MFIDKRQDIPLHFIPIVLIWMVMWHYAVSSSYVVWWMWAIAGGITVVELGCVFCLWRFVKE